MVLPISYAPAEQSIGGNFGTGLGQGLTNLINMKLAEVQRQKGLQGLFPSEQAQLLGQLNPELLAPIIKEQARAQRQLQSTGPGLKVIAPELSEDQATKIGSLSKGVQNLWYKEYQDNPAAAIERLNKLPEAFAPKDVQKFAKELQAANKQEPLNKELTNLAQQQQLKQQVGPGQIASQITQAPGAAEFYAKQAASQAAQAQPQAPVAKQETKSPEKQELIPKIKNTSDFVKEGFAKSEAQNLAKEEIKQFQSDVKESKSIGKEIKSDNKAAKENENVLNEMERLIKKGNLAPAGLYRFIKGLEDIGAKSGATVGAGLGYLSGFGPVGVIAGGATGALIKPIASMVESGVKNVFPDTEAFEKLQGQFLKGMKNIFGSRVTNFDVNTFLNTIPTLMQTDNGKLQIINNMRILNQAAKLRYKTMKDVLKETKGKYPPNLDDIIDDKIGSQLDNLFGRINNEEPKQAQTAEQPAVALSQVRNIEQLVQPLNMQVGNFGAFR